MQSTTTEPLKASTEDLSFGLEELEQRLETVAIGAGAEPNGGICCECTLYGCPNIP